MENQTNQMPRLGDAAPAFEAKTTQGPINFPGDFRGRWIILFSHPSDFTPVCTTEFIAFARRNERFEELDCQLVGLSVGGLQSHIAWLRAIEKMDYKGSKGTPIRFPLIVDLSMRVAQLYGMIQPHESDTSAVRAVFFIDPQGIIRTILCYPLSLGRNFDEIERILVALQTIDKYGVSLPADWQPGDDVVVPSPSTLKAAREQTQHAVEGATCYDWFLCLRPLSEARGERRKSERREPVEVK